MLTSAIRKSYCPRRNGEKKKSVETQTDFDKFEAMKNAISVENFNAKWTKKWNEEITLRAYAMNFQPINIKTGCLKKIYKTTCLCGRTCNAFCVNFYISTGTLEIESMLDEGLWFCSNQRLSRITLGDCRQLDKCATLLLGQSQNK